MSWSNSKTTRNVLPLIVRLMAFNGFNLKALAGCEKIEPAKRRLRPRSTKRPGALYGGVARTSLRSQARLCGSYRPRNPFALLLPCPLEGSVVGYGSSRKGRWCNAPTSGAYCHHELKSRPSSGRLSWSLGGSNGKQLERGGNSLLEHFRLDP